MNEHVKWVMQPSFTTISSKPAKWETFEKPKNNTQMYGSLLFCFLFSELEMPAILRGFLLSPTFMGQHVIDKKSTSSQARSRVRPPSEPCERVLTHWLLMLQPFLRTDICMTASFDYNYQNAFRWNLSNTDLCHARVILHKRYSENNSLPLCILVVVAQWGHHANAELLTERVHISCLPLLFDFCEDPGFDQCTPESKFEKYD